MTPKDNELRMRVALVVTHTDGELLFVRSEKYANTLDALQAFADLVRQDERDKCAQDYLQDCNSAIDAAVDKERQACAEQYLGIMRNAVEKAILRERDNCAKLCDKKSYWNGRVATNQPIFELPICDVCNKPVEYMDGRNDINFDSRIFRVKCHGEMQEVALTALTMLDCTVTTGRAFVLEKLK